MTSGTTWQLGALVNRAFPIGFDDMESGSVWIHVRGRCSGNERPALSHPPSRLERVFTFEMPSGTLARKRHALVHIQRTEISEKMGD